MEGGKINSVLNQKDQIESNFLYHEHPRSLKERVESIKPQVEKQLEDFEAMKIIIEKANQLLKKYGNSKNIPFEELDIETSGFDDARLLAFCETIEEKRKQIQHTLQ